MALIERQGVLILSGMDLIYFTVADMEDRKSVV